jgi:hypothetical protein
MPASINISTRHSDVTAQQRVIETGLKRFRDLVNSDLGLFPEDVQRILRYVHDHLFEESLTVDRLKADCKLKNHNVTAKFRLAVGLGMHE